MSSGPEEVRVPRRAALVDARAAGRAAWRWSSETLEPSSRPPVPGLAPWPMVRLDGVRLAHVVDVDPVARGQHLVDQGARVLALGRQHPAVAGGVGRADAGAPRPRAVLALGERAPELMPVIMIGQVELDRLLGVARAQHRPGHAALAVALQGDAGQRAGEERQVVEGGPAPLAQRAEAADAVAAQLRLGLDVLDHLRRYRWRWAQHAP